MDEDLIRWVAVTDRLPLKSGLYKIKTKTGIVGATIPYVRNAMGVRVWLTPDVSDISHWEETIKLKQK